MSWKKKKKKLNHKKRKHKFGWWGRLPPSRVLGEKEWEGGKCHA
jgi:hypothetical protein